MCGADGEKQPHIFKQGQEKIVSSLVALKPRSVCVYLSPFWTNQHLSAACLQCGVHTAERLHGWMDGWVSSLLYVPTCLPALNVPIVQVGNAEKIGRLLSRNLDTLLIFRVTRDTYYQATRGRGLYFQNTGENIGILIESEALLSTILFVVCSHNGSVFHSPGKFKMFPGKKNK